MRIVSIMRSLLFALVLVLVSTPSFAQISIFVRFGPPALPVYEQPLCPGEGYVWTPGFWAYDPNFDDYYWVPGTWVLAPQVGYLWTPGYWAWGPNGFFFNQGYWGPVVGFYGGIYYGFGYFGHGYEGGRWDHDRFYYNRSVNNINVTNIHNVYNTTVINNTNVNRVSYNGGDGGITARPNQREEAAARERHIPPVAAQTQHVEYARADQQLRASVNQGKPPVAATQQPGAFKGSGIVPAKEAGAPYHPPANRAAGQPTGNPSVPRPENTVPVHAKDLPPHAPPAPPSTGNPKQDQKYQQQQQKLYAQQEQEHQKLSQQQEQEHQRMAQQQADEAKVQQMEHQHQQQTQQMEQKHTQQQQQLQQRQQPPSHNQPKPQK